MEVKLRNSTETVEEMIASEVLFNCVKGCLNKIRTTKYYLNEIRLTNRWAKLPQNTT
jgi:hypothetical protein